MNTNERFSGEWETKRLEEIGDISGAGVDKKVNSNEVSVRLVNYLDVYNQVGFLYVKRRFPMHEVSARPFSSVCGVAQLKKVMFSLRLPPKCLMIYVVRQSPLENIADGVYSYHVVRLRLKENWDLYFRGYVFKTKEFLDEASRQCEGSGTRYVISLPNFAQWLLCFPPSIEEQRAIAKVLSDVDGLINALDALIAKKRAIKQATMQQLLTGKTRLPGFSGAWETKRLGKLGTFSKGRGIKRDDVSDDGVPCIRYGELYTRYQDYILKVVSRIPPGVAETALPIKTGDLLFAGSGETAEEIGRCAAYFGEEQTYAGGDVIVLTPSGQNSIYLGHLMNSPTVSAQKARMGQGDAVVHIYINNLAQVQIELPPIAEQRAIASVLSDMDTEIAALEHRRDKTIAIKRGMMQQLLTGKVRLLKSE